MVVLRTLSDYKDAAALWGEFAAGDDCPWYLEAEERMEDDQLDVLLSRLRTGIKTGRVRRTIRLRAWSQEGPVVLEWEVPDIPQAVRALTEGVQAGVGLAELEFSLNWEDRCAWAWRAWLTPRLMGRRA